MKKRRKWKGLLAWILVSVLCVGMRPVGISAGEPDGGQTEPSVTTTTPTDQYTTGDGDTVTVTTETTTNQDTGDTSETTTTVTDSGSSQTVNTKTEATTNTGTGTEKTENAEITVTITTDTTENPDGSTTTTTDTEKEWNGTATQDKPTVTDPKDDEGNPVVDGDGFTTTEISGSVTTEVEGSENKTESDTTDPQGRPLKEEGNLKGEETTTVTDTTVTEKEQTQSVSQTKEDGVPVVTEKETGSYKETEKKEPVSSTDDVDLKYGEHYDDITVDLTPGSNKTETQKPDISDELPELKPGTTETVGANGEKIETVITEIKDSDGTVIGYEITKTTVSSVSDPDSKTEAEGQPVTTVTEGQPARPQAGTVTDQATGNVTTVTVDEIYGVGADAGKVIGYHTTTVVTDASGRQLSTREESIWGTRTTTTTVEETPETTETVSKEKVTTTTTTVYTKGVTKEKVEITATNREVKASMTDVAEKKGHGNVDMDSLVPDLENKKDGSLDKRNDLYNRVNQIVEKGDFKEHPYQWLGEYGLESAIRVEAGEEPSWQPHQFVLEDENGQKYYVYCADFEVSPQEGWYYDMVNVEDATYYDTEEAEHIRAIASNGYWGTNSGQGSLEAVKQLLRDAKKAEKVTLSDDEIDALTPGEALTATQAAIWKFGNSGDTEQDPKNIVGWYYKGGNDFNYNYSNDAVQQLYNYLITLKEAPTPDTTLITKEDITGASITVKDKVQDGKDSDSDIYNTSVSFTLAVIPSQVNNDLVVNVYDGDGTLIATKRLAGDDSQTNYGVIRPDANGTYTIDGLELEEGVNITLNLNGTQNLDQGVYLYTSEVRTGASQPDSQTFVGISSGKRDVNLSVELTFDVTEPTAKTDPMTAALEDEVHTAKNMTSIQTVMNSLVALRSLLK